jgi:DNA-directed RNA polymerase sigma subunit (sigma70/sigma32)
MDTEIKLKRRRGNQGLAKAKLTPEQVKNIRKRFAKDPELCKAEVGREFGITGEAVGQIVSRKTWLSV